MRRPCLAAYLIALIITTSAVMFSMNQHHVSQAKHAVLEEDRHVIQQAIRDYTIDKGHPPASLDALFAAGYLKSIPATQIDER